MLGILPCTCAVLGIGPGMTGTDGVGAGSLPHTRKNEPRTRLKTMRISKLCFRRAFVKPCGVNRELS